MGCLKNCTPVKMAAVLFSIVMITLALKKLKQNCLDLTANSTITSIFRALPFEGALIVSSLQFLVTEYKGY